MEAPKRWSFWWWVWCALGFMAFAIGGGRIGDLLIEHGGREVKIKELEKDLEELKNAGSKGTSVPADSSRGEGLGFEVRILAQAQYLEQQIEEIELPGFTEMTSEEKRSTVKCLVYHLAFWEKSQDCRRRGAVLLPELYCQDPVTRERVEIPVEVKRLGAFCAVQE